MYKYHYQVGPHLQETPCPNPPTHQQSGSAAQWRTTAHTKRSPQLGSILGSRQSTGGYAAADPIQLATTTVPPHSTADMGTQTPCKPAIMQNDTCFTESYGLFTLSTHDTNLNFVNEDKAYRVTTDADLHSLVIEELLCLRIQGVAC